MPALASNFTANSLSGTVKVSGGTANIRLVVEPIAFEGTKQFVLKIRKDSTQGAVIGATSNITIVDISSIVGVTANTATVLEGNLVSFTITTANVPNNANVYFSVLPASANITSQDFEANTGRFTIVNNEATFALKANADLSLMDESGETFKLQVRTVSPVGNIVFTTSNIAITDFSKGYGTIFFTPSATNYYENDAMRFQLRTVNAANAVLYYSTTGGNAAASNFIANTGSFTVGADNFANITLTANTNIPINETRTFQLQVRIGDASGTLMTTSELVTIGDINLAPVIGTGGTISRAQGYVIHAFTAPGTFTINKPANLQYLLVAAGGKSAFGGGGGGGVLYGNTIITANSYPISIGFDGGGNGADQWGPVAAPTGSGGNSTFFGLSAKGGGGGGSQFANQGGSGGGGGINGGGTNPGGGSVAGQGNDGAPGSVPAGVAGGGGGAGAAASGSNGGNGRQLDITGTATYYGGGAGGRSSPSDDTGTNGLGSSFASYGGAGLRTGPGKAGNGIVVVRYVGENYVSLNRSAPYIVEGGNITFTLTTLNVSNGTPLYYSITGPNTLTTDFVTGNTGTILITNNSNTFTLVATTPNKERVETLTIQVKAAVLSTEVLLSNTFSYIKNLIPLDYLVVAGGGSSPGAGSSGAGGGGVVYSSSSLNVISGTPYTIVVGAVGGNSTAFDVQANAGGSGANQFGVPGGSGSGGGRNGGGTNGGGSSTQTSYPGSNGVGLGNSGGSGVVPGIFSAGGGGGAGGEGVSGSPGAGGPGGNGYPSSITGTATYYGGGGGGYSGTSVGTAGLGAGSYGAGGSGSGSPGGAVQGTVIIRYANTFAAASNTTGSPNVTLSGGYRIYQWTSSGSITL